MVDGARVKRTVKLPSTTTPVLDHGETSIASDDEEETIQNRKLRAPSMAAPMLGMSANGNDGMQPSVSRNHDLTDRIELMATSGAAEEETSMPSLPSLPSAPLDSSST
jgi:hypothetical protein